MTMLFYEHSLLTLACLLFDLACLHSFDSSWKTSAETNRYETMASIRLCEHFL